MVRHSDANLERLVQRSLVFRVLRSLFLAIDAAAAQSKLLWFIRPPSRLAEWGTLLIVASLVHAVLVVAIPPALAPVGRYAFAVAGFLIGVALLLLGRSRRVAGRGSDSNS